MDTVYFCLTKNHSNHCSTLEHKVRYIPWKETNQRVFPEDGLLSQFLSQNFWSREIRYLSSTLAERQRELMVQSSLRSMIIPQTLSLEFLEVYS